MISPFPLPPKLTSVLVQLRDLSLQLPAILLGILIFDGHCLCTQIGGPVEPAGRVENTLDPHPANHLVVAHLSV